MIWDKPITAGGYTVSPEHLQAAWDGWWRQGGGQRHALTRWLEFYFTGEKYLLPNYHSLTTRILLRAKREGVIRFNGRAWEPVREAQP